MPFGIGLTELLLIAVVVLLLFGGRKIPELARGIGESIKILRSGFSEKKTKSSDDLDDE